MRSWSMPKLFRMRDDAPSRSPLIAISRCSVPTILIVQAVGLFLGALHQALGARREIDLVP